MKRAFVTLLFALMLASTAAPALAASDLSPFHGLTFDDPVSTFADLEVRRILSLDIGAGHEIIWGCYTLPAHDSVAGFDITYMRTPPPPDEYSYEDYYKDYYENYYDAFKVGNYSSTGPTVERGPVESLAGLPAFYTIHEMSANGVVTRGIIWHILCEDRIFHVSTSYVDTPSTLIYSEQRKKIFDDFLKSLGATSELKPAPIGDGGDGGSGGGSGDGDGGSDDGGSGDGGSGGGSSDGGTSGGGSSSGGGCNAFGGVFGLSALVIVSALKRTKKA